MKEKIQNKELQEIVRRELNKTSFEEVTDEDLNKIEYIRLPKYLINGRNTEILVSSIKFFINLKSVKFIGYTITDNDLQDIMEIDGLNQIEFERCNFEKVDFELFKDRKTKLIFFRCSSLPLNYFKAGKVHIDSMSVDFNDIDFKQITELTIEHSIIKNAVDLDDYEQLEYVNFNDSKILNKDGTEYEDLIVPLGCKYSHVIHDKYPTDDYNQRR